MAAKFAAALVAIALSAKSMTAAVGEAIALAGDQATSTTATRQRLTNLRQLDEILTQLMHASDW